VVFEADYDEIELQNIVMTSSPVPPLHFGWVFIQKHTLK